MKFFVDNNLSAHLAHGMQEFGESVEHLTDQFSDDTADTEWLRYIGDGEIFLITRDDRIRRNPAELEALRNHKVGAFFIGGKNRSRCDIIQQVVRNWPRIKQLASRQRKPFAFRVPPKGTKIDKIPL
jgi:predicted nuclease of predicted toxin-antitoxin system